MPVVHAVDKKGKVMKAEYVDRFFFPQPPFASDLQTHLDHIRHLQLRNDDILICAFPKSGTHWVWEMVQMVRNGEARYDSRSKETLMLDFTLKETLDSLPSPRTLNSHFLFRHLPAEIVQRKTKIIFISSHVSIAMTLCRDPRDVVVSWFSHMKNMKDIISPYDGEFCDFLPLFVEGTMAYGSWFDYTKKWEKRIEANPDIPILPLYYEQMKQDPVGTVKELSKFLGVVTSDELCAAVAEACDFRKLKEANDREKSDPLQFIWKEGCPGIYRKGQTGDWKNWFTVAQLEEFDAIYNRKMAGTKIFPRYRQGTS